MDQKRLEGFAARVRHLRRTDVLDAAAAEVLGAFDSAGVSALLLKGVALARALYAGETKRGYSDVDLLVPPSQLDTASRVLSALGFVNTTRERGVEDVAGAVHAETWIRRDQTIGPLMVDLHTRLPGVQLPPAEAWEVLERNRAAIEVGGRDAFALNHEGLAFHLALHAAQHGLWDPKPIAELGLALEQWPEPIWRGANALATELDGLAAFAAGLRLVPMGAALAERLRLPEPSEIEWDLENRARRPRGTFHLQALADAGTAGERMRLVWQMLVPSREWLEWEDPRARRGGLPLVHARVRHLLRLPGWSARAVVYRVRRSRGTRVNRP